MVAVDSEWYFAHNVASREGSGQTPSGNAQYPPNHEGRPKKIKLLFRSKVIYILHTTISIWKSSSVVRIFVRNVIKGVWFPWPYSRGAFSKASRSAVEAQGSGPRRRYLLPSPVRRRCHSTVHSSKNGTDNRAAMPPMTKLYLFPVR